jgi:hypothetical protein
MGDGVKFLDYSSVFKHTIKKNSNITDIKNDMFWCPEDSKLSTVVSDILNTNPIFNDLDSSYYNNTKVNSR